MTTDEKLDAILAVTKHLIGDMRIREFGGMLCFVSDSDPDFCRTINHDYVESEIQSAKRIAFNTYEQKLSRIVEYYERKLAAKTGSPVEPEPDDLSAFKDALSQDPAP